MNSGEATPLDTAELRPDGVGRSGRLAALIDCGLLVLLFAVFLILLPFQNAPLIDDAVFAWSVQWLMQHGQFRVLEYSHINPTQVLWGALFCLPGGFSFTALRLSNWVLGASTLCGLYLTLREFGVSRKLSVAGAATLAVNPLFVVLSCSFMTDIPLLAMATWGTYALVLAVRRKSDRWLWAASLFGTLACGVRIPGAVLPIAAGCVLLFHTGRWGRRPDRLLSALLPVAFLGLLLVIHDSLTHPTIDISAMKNSLSGRLYLLSYAWRFLPSMLLGGLLFVAAMGGLCMLPLALGGMHAGMLRRVGIALSLLILAAIILLWLGQTPFHPLAVGQTWEWEELGATTDLVAGRLRPIYPVLVMSLLLVFSLALGAVALARGFWRRSIAGESALRWQIFGHFLLCAILWLTYDRYILPFLPLLVILFLVGLPRLRMAPFVTGILLLTGVSMAGVHDHLAYNRALWGCVDKLRGEGVPVSAIDAGYPVNLWTQYAHPEDAPLDVAGNAFVPHMTSGRSVEYLIANSPMPGYEIVRTVPVSRWMGRATSLYVLHRAPDAKVFEPVKTPEKW